MSARRSHARLSATPSAYACPRRPQARSQDRFVRSSRRSPPRSHSRAMVAMTRRAPRHTRAHCGRQFRVPERLPVAVQKQESAILGLIRSKHSERKNVGGSAYLNATSKKKTGAQTAFTMQQLWRQVLWGCIAAAALLLAILAGFTDSRCAKGGDGFVVFERRSICVSAHHPGASTGPSAARSPDSDLIVRQLTQTVRGLTEDRDRIVKRLAAMERNLDDITGSISQQIEAAKAPSAPPVEPGLPLRTPRSWPRQKQRMPPAGKRRRNLAPLNRPPHNRRPTVAARHEWRRTAAEIGSASSIKALHARWAGIRSGHLRTL